MDSRIAALVRLCEVEIAETERYTVYGLMYNRTITEERGSLALKLTGNLETPKWEDDEFWVGCVLKGLSYRLACLRVVRRELEEKVSGYLSDIEPMALEIVKGLKTANSEVN